MEAQVYFIEDAENDLDEIYSYLINYDSPEAAEAVLERIENACQSLKALPHRGHVPPEMGLLGMKTYKEVRAGVHRIIYEVRGESVFIHGVFDARRDLEVLLPERLVK